MRAVIEQVWVRVLNSDAWRRAARSSLGSKILRSDLFDDIDTARRRTVTWFKERRDPEAFGSVRTCLVFIGHVKSGGSLLGALLDAHPDAVMADEIDIPRYVKAGFSRDQIFHLLVKGARRESLKGRVTARRLDPYSLAVPGQWQGRFRQLNVIGESRAGPTTRQLGSDAGLLDRIRSLIAGVDVRFVHVVRSPWDPIGAMVARSGKSLSVAITEYEERCDILLQLRDRIAPSEIATVFYEDLVRDPSDELARVCEFAGLDPSQEYLDAASSIVRTDRVPERQRVVWTDSGARRVENLIRYTGFLNRYEGDRPGEIAWRTS